MSKEEYQKARAPLFNALNSELQRISSMKDPTEQNRAMFDWVKANEKIHQLDAEFLQKYLVGVVEKFSSSTERLVGLTRVLEYLTRVLIALTLLLVIQPLIIQVVTVWGLPAIAIIFILITVYLTGRFRKSEASESDDSPT